MTDADVYVGGIEGGATHSTLVLYKADGSSVCTVEDGPTNIWVTGEDKTADVLVNMVHNAKEKAGIPQSTPLAALGLTLAGMDYEETQEKLRGLLLARDENLAKVITLCTDATGAAYSLSANGGTILIAGTGSATRLVTPEGTELRSGGWGHAIGDEGSAYSIAARALKVCYQLSEGVVSKKFEGLDHKPLLDAAFKYFKMENRFDVLPYLYSDFEKKKVAGFCVHVATAAKNGDPLAKLIMSRAGKKLAMLILGVVSQHKARDARKDILTVGCVGSVWKSLPLFQDTLVETLVTGGGIASRGVSRFRLVRLDVPSSAGAAGLAARRAGVTLNLDYPSHSTPLVEHGL